MKSAFFSGCALTSRTSQLGHFLWSQTFLPFPGTLCFLNVMPQAMAMWFGPLIVPASRIVLALSDQLHL